MLPRLILAIAVICLVFWLYNKWRKLPQNKRKSFAVKSVLIAAGVLILAAVLTGRMHWIGAVFAGLLALGRVGIHTAMRAAPMLRLFGRAPFLNNPRFKTPYLDVQVNIKSLDVYGSIISGPHSGKNITDLSEKELDELEQFYEANNKASLYLIRVIRQKSGPSSRQSKGFPAATNLSVDEAFQVLGLKPDASKKEAIQAHRSLMQKLHPDRGGNDYLASRVNLAKDTLVDYFDGKEAK